jgi:3-hydroxy-3-methylglutaryl CoA synthase
MVSIKSYGAYIPFHRLRREEIGRAWEAGPLRGEKAVANYDEDSITMAVEAGLDCLKGFEPDSIDALLFASTTAPYKEKQSAALVATALNLRRNIFTTDFANSLRAGTNAIRTAVDAVKAGSARNVLVVASDCRLGTPGSEFEQLFGDGAAALIISDTGGAAIEGSYTHTDEIIDLWRAEGQDFVKSWEDRFVITQGYNTNVREGVSSALKQFSATTQDYAKVVLYASDGRRHQEMARALKLDSKTQLQDPMFDSVGNTGCAFALMMLVGALEDAKAEDKVLLINYGDGCDVFSLQVKDKMSENSDRRGVKGYLNSKRLISNYEKYIRLRRLMQVEIGRRRPPMVSSAAVLHRDRKMVLGLHASKCKSCDRLFFPPQRVCLYCQAKDQNEEVRMAEMKGKLYTFCKDLLAQSVDPPIITSIVNLDGGVRFYAQMTDRDPDKIEVDMPMELTFRKMQEAEGFNSYFWKCRPVR